MVINSPAIAAGTPEVADLSNTISTTSAGEEFNLYRHYQEYTCRYRRIEIPDGSWPVTKERICIDLAITGAFLLDLQYTTNKTIESLPLPVGSNPASRIPHDVSCGSYTSTTGLGSSGIIVTTQPGIKTRLAKDSDQEISIGRMFPNIVLYPDPTFSDSALLDDPQILKWFAFRLLPQLIKMGGQEQELGLGVVNEIANYSFQADYSPGNLGSAYRTPLPANTFFKLELMKT